MTKVYTGTITIEEHMNKLTELYGYKPRTPKQIVDEAIIEGLCDSVTNNKPKQSIEVQRLKREAGLLKD